MAFHGNKDNEASLFRKEKDRISRRFQTNLEAIIAKYDRPFAGSDVLDLNDMTIVEDRGFLGSAKPLKIGTTKLAVEKASYRPCSGNLWNATKDSTDSAFGSTRYSESEDTSGTETIAQYIYQDNRFAIAGEAEKADLRLDDAWMGNGSHSDDSGNEDMQSDYSGPICILTKSPSCSPTHRRRKPNTVSDWVAHAARPSIRGNLSRRFDTEEGQRESASKRETLSRISPVDDKDDDEDDEEENEDDDPYEFREEELPSILEEKNRFLSKMQSILVESFIDGDDIDEMDSQTDDEISTETVESSEATSSSVSAWSTLPPKTPPKRSSKSLALLKQDDSNLDDARCEIPVQDIQGNACTPRVWERDVLSSTDLDDIECSTILAGNLHDDRDVIHQSDMLRRTNQQGDLVRNRPTQPPFQAICNSTMLNERNPSGNTSLNSKSSLDLKQPRSRELPLDGQGEIYLGDVPQNGPLNLKLHTSDEQLIETPQADRDVQYNTPKRPELPENPKEVKRKDKCTTDENLGQTNFCTPTIRSHSYRDYMMSPSGCGTPGITPRARLKKCSLQQTLSTLSSPRFNTNEIMEIFRSPKPLIIPGMDLQSLDLTPRRKLRREGVVTPTGPLRNALRRLQSPCAKQRTDRNSALTNHTAKEIQPRSQGAGDETTLDLSVATQEQRTSHTERNESEISKKPPQAVQTHMIRAIRQTVQHGDQQHNPRTDSGVTDTKIRQSITCHHSQQTPSPKSSALSGGTRSTHPTRTKRAIQSAKVLLESDSDPYDVPTSRQLQSREASVEKSVQQSQPARHTSREAITQGPTKERQITPVPSKTPSRSSRAKKCLLTLPTEQSPSTMLSSPLNHMSLTSPPRLYRQKKDELAKDYERNRFPGLDAHTKDRVASVEKRNSSKTEKENLKLKSRKLDLGDKTRLDATHMTIRQSGDDSEEEDMVDPYSLTADDSSPCPRLYQQRPMIHSAHKSSKRSLAQQGRCRGKGTKSKDSEKLRYSYSKTDDQSIQRHLKHSKGEMEDCKKSQTKSERHSDLSSGKRKLFGGSRQSYNPRKSENPVDSRGASDAALLNIQSPSMRRKEQSTVGSIQKSPHSSQPPSPIYGDSAELSKHEQQTKSSKSVSKVITRREHSQYFSDEECNSSGDSAKFLSSIPNRSGIKGDSDPSRQLKIYSSPQHKKLGHTERTTGTKHKTTIKCGQIISTPKSAKGMATASPDLHKTTPSRWGHVEKTSKTRKSVAQKLMASPSSHHGNVRSMETGRPAVSSPLRASGCNVSSSYTCEGPGYCTKPFCFNCALSEVS